MGCLALMPFVSIFWEDRFGFLKANWILYPIFIFGIIAFILARGTVNRPFAIFAAFFAFYLTIFLLRRNGDVQGLLRIMISVIPFLFLPFFADQKISTSKFFLISYTLFFLPSIYMAYLQYTGSLPYNEFDYVDGQAIGRMSGGYSKPMNFIAFLNPLYVLGLYLIVVLKRRFIGVVILLGILVVIYEIGHRTSLAAYILIAGAMFFKKFVFMAIYNYYKYYVNFFTGVFLFLFFYILKVKEGMIDAFRGRIPMWQAHAQEFFQADSFSIIFGKQRVLLPDSYRDHPFLFRFDEVHNNSFRTIILFGIFGFFIYCTFMRWLVISSYHAQEDRNKRFVMFASLIYFILYTVTNEPMYYASVLWPIMVWLFLLRNDNVQRIHG